MIVGVFFVHLMIDWLLVKTELQWNDGHLVVDLGGLEEL